MSASNKNRLEVQKILRDTVLDGLSALNESGWEVIEFANASLQKSNKVILLNLVRNNRVGWQSEKDETINDELKRTEEWIEEQSWQLHFICKRVGTATVTDTLAEDLAGNMIVWLNGPGIEVLRSKGVAPLRIENTRVIVYNDNSDLYQKRAVFTVKIQVPKELTFEQEELEAIQPKLKPI